MLTLAHEIICSDEDQIIADYLILGYTDSLDLVVYIRSHDAEKGCSKYVVAAFVEKEDAYYLAHRLNTSMKELPAVLAQEFDNDIINADRDQVSDMFKDIVEFLSDNKCRYKIVSSPRSLESLG